MHPYFQTELADEHRRSLMEAAATRRRHPIVRTRSRRLASSAAPRLRIRRRAEVCLAC